MFKAVSKVFVIAMVLVAFVGQAIAYNTSLPCEPSEDSHVSGTAKASIHQNIYSIETDTSDDCCGIECCDVDCTCIANGCSSFAYFSTDLDSTKSTALYEAFYIKPTERLTAIYTLLYRPPIYIS